MPDLTNIPDSDDSSLTEDVAALLSRADNLYEKWQFKNAGALYRQVLNIDHDNVDALFGWASVAFSLGNYENAEKLGGLILSQHPDHIEALLVLGKAQAACKKFDEARSHFLKAIESAPEDVRAYYNIAMSYFEQSDYNQAALHAVHGVRALVKPSDKAKLYTLLARASAFRFKRHKAVMYYEIALRHLDDPSMLYETYRELASLQMDFGKTERAEHYVREALGLQADCINAHCMLAQLKAADIEDEYVQRMYDLCEKGASSVEDKARLHFALGRVCDARHETDQAFTHYDAGNALVRSEYSFDIASVHREFEKIRKMYHAGITAHTRVDAHDMVTPIFIVGMPRSGTTLTEQILSSHPEVGGAGELVVMDELYVHEALNDLAAYDFDALNIDSERLERAAFQYLSILSQRVPGHRYVTDKMPMNFKYIGLIRMMFPQAKIIHCIRDELDCGLSIYQHRFVGKFPFAYNLTELGQYIKQYKELMAHWHETLPGYVYDLEYAKMVTDQKAETHKLLDFCGLPWHEDCMTFHKNERAVLTASALQVKQKIYASSLGKAAKYDKYLDPLKKALL